MPLAFMPPNGVRRSRTFWALIQTSPLSISCATRWAREMSCVHTYAASPYSVAFASRIASSTPSKGVATSTGPKISSLEYAHLGRHVREHRRLEVVALVEPFRALAAGEEACAFVECRLDVAEHTLVVLRPDQRPELGALVERVADADVPCALGDRCHEIVVDRRSRQGVASRRCSAGR